MWAESRPTYELRTSHVTPVREECLTCFSQSGGHLILSGVDVTGSPATLGPESHQSLNQDLRGSGDTRSPHLHEVAAEVRKATIKKKVRRTGWEDVQPSEQWCGYTPLSWPRPAASPPGLSSSRRWGQTCLGRNIKLNSNVSSCRRRPAWGGPIERRHLCINHVSKANSQSEDRGADFVFGKKKS